MRAATGRAATVRVMLSHRPVRSPRLRPLRSGRGRRGIAVLVTVLLTVVAATIALLLAQQTVFSATTSAARRDIDAAYRDARAALTQLESALAVDPDSYLGRVLEVERARVCPVGPRQGDEIQPGERWPAECGTTWGYAPAASPGDVRVELRAPSAASAHLAVRVLARSGGADAGFDARYLPSRAGRWAVASTSALDLGDLHGSDAAAVTGGGVYAEGQVGLPAAPSLTLTGARVATESGFNGSPADPTVGWFSPSPVAGPPAVRPVRDAQPDRLDAAALAGQLDAAARACATAAGTLTGGPAHGSVSRLCVTAGGTVELADGSAATVPAGANAYLLVFGLTVPGEARLFASDRPLDLGPGSPLLCSPQPGCQLRAHAAAMGSQFPGALTYWNSNPATGSVLVGDVKLPASGFIATDRTVQLGVCHDETAQYALGSQCVTRAGAPGPGMAVTSRLTVVAGSAAAPRDVVLGSPSHRISGQPSVIASGRVVLPYWARPSGTHTFDYDITAVGSGTGAQPSFGAFPADLPSAGPTDPDRTAEVRVRGQLWGANLRLGLPGAARFAVELPTDAATAPGASGATTRWELSHSVRLSGDDVCGARVCDEF